MQIGQREELAGVGAGTVRMGRLEVEDIGGVILDGGGAGLVACEDKGS